MKTRTKKAEITLDARALVARVESSAAGRQPACERTVKLPPPVKPIPAKQVRAIDRIHEACQMLAGYPRTGKSRDDLARVLDLKFVDGRLESVSDLSAEMAKIREQ